MRDLKGSTANERIVEAGLMNAWIEAGNSHDRAKMAEILSEIGDLSPEETVNIILTNPKFYGFE